MRLISLERLKVLVRSNLPVKWAYRESKARLLQPDFTLLQGNANQDQFNLDH